ncbi:MAG TPA: acetylglutamate kinase [Fimbriimonadaceae bacterium]|nr:acetylglutamate kinase [Fimbriimonadaceae bacterium]
MAHYADQAAVLAQALPYIQAFHGQTFVIKYGGSAMRDPETVSGVIRNVLLIQSVGIKPVLVHGGGPEIDRWLERLGVEKKTVNGLRVTDDFTMEVVEMALSGRANKALVAEIGQAGGKGVGLSGRDAGLLVGEAISAELGRVGRVTRVNPDVLESVLADGFVPVVATVANDIHGEPLNVNADTAAAAIAGAVGASKLILLTDTDGVLADKNDPGSTISRLTARQAGEMIDNGAADKGMVPKLQAGLNALEEGVHSVHLICGGTPNALLIEVFTEAGIGTMLCR